MNNEQERNEHFKGFAMLLWEEMLSQTEGFYIDVSAGHIPLHHPEDEEHKRYIDLIAQRAYDLVLHTVWNIAPADLERLFMKEVATKVPDLTEWPKMPLTTSAPDE